MARRSLPAGMHYMGGLLADARGGGGLHHADPERLQALPADELAPDRALWGSDNRGVMVRVLGGRAPPPRTSRTGSGSRRPIPTCTSPRRWWPVWPGWLRSMIPAPPPMRPTRRRQHPCPRTLGAALAALETSEVFRDGFGTDFVDYFLRLKRAEIARFEAEVSEWEQREYFDLF